MPQPTWTDMKCTGLHFNSQYEDFIVTLLLGIRGLHTPPESLPVGEVDSWTTHQNSGDKLFDFIVTLLNLVRHFIVTLLFWSRGFQCHNQRGLMRSTQVNAFSHVKNCVPLDDAPVRGFFAAQICGNLERMPACSSGRPYKVQTVPPPTLWGALLSTCPPVNFLVGKGLTVTPKQ